MQHLDDVNKQIATRLPHQKTHNIRTNLDINLNKTKPLAKNLLNLADNLPRRGAKPQFSDLQVLALALTAEALAIDNENLLSHKLKSEYENDFQNLILRRQFNYQRKNLQSLLNQIRHNIAMSIDQGENYVWSTQNRFLFADWHGRGDAK